MGLKDSKSEEVIQKKDAVILWNDLSYRNNVGSSLYFQIKYIYTWEQKMLEFYPSLELFLNFF